MSGMIPFGRKFNIKKRVNKYKVGVSEDKAVTIQEMTKIVRDTIVSFQSDKYSTKFHQSMIDRCKGGDLLAQNYIKEFMQFIVDEYSIKGFTQEHALNEIFKYLYGLDVIDDIYRDPRTEEIRINDYDDIYQVIGGKSYKVHGLKFRDRKAVEYLISRMTMHEGKEINMSTPNIESELFDGSRLTASISPETSVPSFVLRKHNTISFDTETLVRMGTIDEKMVGVLQLLIKARSNVLLIGGTNTGKTHTLKWLVNFINPKHRICTLERVRELKLKDHYAKRGEEREVVEFVELPTIGRTMIKQFETLLRYSPDIIIVGEARGPEAAEMVNANISGHEGGIGTIHANSANEAIDRLLRMLSLDGTNRTRDGSLREICKAFDVIILLRRYEDGSRKIAEISFLDYDEVNKKEKITTIMRYMGGKFQCHPQKDHNFLEKLIYRFDQNGVTIQDLHKVGIIE